VRGGSHGRIKVSAISKILMAKSLRASETLVSKVYMGCNGLGCIHTQVV
jgi:hypothetical protein